MRILFLSPRVPDPPDKGDKIRSHHLMRRLASRHEVHAAFLLDEPADAAHAESVARWAASTSWAPRRALESVVRGGWTAATGRPLSVGWFRSGDLVRRVARRRAEVPFDVALAYCSSMAGYLEDFSGPRVVDFVDVDSLKWKQYSERSGFPKSAVYSLEHRLLRKYERHLCTDWDRVVIISAAERDMLGDFADVGRVDVVENGVDSEAFRRSAERPRAPELVFVGALDYFANAEGIAWFVRDVWGAVRARVPAARLRIVGRKPGPAVRALGEVAGVEVVGDVPSVPPELWRSSIAVVPLRIAQGLQNKVLEAMAAGVPVVSSPAAVRALGDPAGAWKVAETADQWAGAIAELVEDPVAADGQAERAVARVAEEYSWDSKARDYERVMERAVAEHGRGGSR
ncbi:MAG: TIGR03087 family PEP-CTERM/XrtA system glycosyltransferase [Gemmatimonadetes bacterium]|nr:TIGR03087 family PEP-CTERM/XrtA system glycosyltransferase [Gemmatimonadota bacterium]